MTPPVWYLQVGELAADGSFICRGEASAVLITVAPRKSDGTQGHPETVLLTIQHIARTKTPPTHSGYSGAFWREYRAWPPGVLFSRKRSHDLELHPKLHPDESAPFSHASDLLFLRFTKGDSGRDPAGLFPGEEFKENTNGLEVLGYDAGRMLIASHEDEVVPSPHLGWRYINYIEDDASGVLAGGGTEPLPGASGGAVLLDKILVGLYRGTFPGKGQHLVMPLPKIRRWCLQRGYVLISTAASPVTPVTPTVVIPSPTVGQSGGPPPVSSDKRPLPVKEDLPVWYIQAGHIDPDNKKFMCCREGSAVLISIQNGSKPRNVLLTVQHMLRSGADKKSGPYYPTIRVWRPGVGFNDNEAFTTSILTELTPPDTSRFLDSEDFAFLALPQDDWRFDPAYPLPTQDLLADLNNLTIAGYSGGQRNFNHHDSIVTPEKHFEWKFLKSSLTSCVGKLQPGFGHPTAGASGGGVFQKSQLAGTYRGEFSNVDKHVLLPVTFLQKWCVRCGYSLVYAPPSEPPIISFPALETQQSVPRKIPHDPEHAANSAGSNDEAPAGTGKRFAEEVIRRWNTLFKSYGRGFLKFAIAISALLVAISQIPPKDLEFVGRVERMIDFNATPPVVRLLPHIQVDVVSHDGTRKHLSTDREARFRFPVPQDAKYSVYKISFPGEAPDAKPEEVQWREAEHPFQLPVKQ